MADTRQHYPAGETGLSQWAYELSLMTAGEASAVALKSCAKLTERFQQDLEDLKRGLVDSINRRKARSDPSKR